MKLIICSIAANSIRQNVNRLHGTSLRSSYTADPQGSSLPEQAPHSDVQGPPSGS